MPIIHQVIVTSLCPARHGWQQCLTDKQSGHDEERPEIICNFGGPMQSMCVCTIETSICSCIAIFYRNGKLLLKAAIMQVPACGTVVEVVTQSTQSICSKNSMLPNFCIMTGVGCGGTHRQSLLKLNGGSLASAVSQVRDALISR